MLISYCRSRILVAKNFGRSPSTAKIKTAKYSLWRINRVSLYCQVVILPKIKPGENLNDEIFLLPKNSRSTVYHLCMLKLTLLGFLTVRSYYIHLPRMKEM